MTTINALDRFKASLRYDVLIEDLRGRTSILLFRGGQRLPRPGERLGSDWLPWRGLEGPPDVIPLGVVIGYVERRGVCVVPVENPYEASAP